MILQLRAVLPFLQPSPRSAVLMLRRWNSPGLPNKPPARLSDSDPALAREGSAMNQLRAGNHNYVASKPLKIYIKPVVAQWAKIPTSMASMRMWLGPRPLSVS